MSTVRYCRACGQVFPNVDASWTHRHAWQVPAQAQQIVFHQAVVALVRSLLVPPVEHS